MNKSRAFRRFSAIILTVLTIGLILGGNWAATRLPHSNIAAATLTPTPTPTSGPTPPPIPTADANRHLGQHQRKRYGNAAHCI